MTVQCVTAILTLLIMQETNHFQLLLVLQRMPPDGAVIAVEGSYIQTSGISWSPHKESVEASEQQCRVKVT